MSSEIKKGESGWVLGLFTFTAAFNTNSILYSILLMIKCCMYNVC